MSTTYGELKSRVSTVLQDPSNRTFTETLVAELVQNALVEVGRLAPQQFTEDIDYVSGQITYALRSDDFAAEAVPEIEVVRVEVWDPTQSPAAFVARVLPASTEHARGSDSGWYVWGGQLTLPTRTATGLEDHIGEYVIRVWGYSPYVAPVSDEDIIDVSKELESAIVEYTHLDGLRMLLANRNLFTQWQIRSGNSDISPAGLMNEKSIAQNDWRMRSRAIQRLRSEV